MKVLSIGDYSSNFTVYEAQVKLLIGIKHAGIDITIQGHFSDEIRSFFVKEGLRIIERRPSGKNDKKFIRALRELMIEEEFDIIHVFGGKNISNTCKAFKDHPVKIIAYLGSTSVYWHDPFVYRTYLNPRLDKIITNSEYITTHLKKQLLKKYSDKPYTIYKGYNPAWFSEVVPFDYKKLNIPENSIVICSAGTHRPVKGMKYLLKASLHLNNNPNVHIVIAGNNTTSKDLNKLKGKSPMKDRIHLLGFRSDILSIIKGSHIYVQTSNSEGLGRSITEAMAMKKPIVVTKAGGCEELVQEGYNGYLAEKKDPASIANEILRIIDDPIKIKEFGLHSFERINSLFHIEITIKRTIELYKILLNKN